MVLSIFLMGHFLDGVAALTLAPGCADAGILCDNTLGNRRLFCLLRNGNHSATLRSPPMPRRWQGVCPGRARTSVSGIYDGCGAAQRRRQNTLMSALREQA